ncbi:MAG: MerR family transcriptional regulator [Proteobacteria bacterium]|nr:MerR family transcriptional regulator [Pseudomonadota bacterium]
MSKWYVKDLSKLTGVSVQTLHHYDRINLLKPSLRLTNKYRLYSEKDLLRLQQIIALKFFGFNLSQIKILLTENVDINDHFSAQAKFLEEKAEALLEASKTLKALISECPSNKSIPWKTILKLIEVYQMTQKLEHSWVKDIFTPDELKQYATFQAELNPEQEPIFKQKWSDLVSKIQDNLEIDPKSNVGIALGKECMCLINELYGKKYAHLRTKKFEKGFAEGKGLEEVGLTPETVSWLDKAMDAYWRDRIYGIFDKVGKVPSETISKLWDETLDDMYGDNPDPKKALCLVALEDKKISKDAKEWLKSISH